MSHSPQQPNGRDFHRHSITDEPRSSAGLVATLPLSLIELWCCHIGWQAIDTSRRNGARIRRQQYEDARTERESQSSRHDSSEPEEGRPHPCHPTQGRIYTLFRKIQGQVCSSRLLFYGRLLEDHVLNPVVSEAASLGHASVVPGGHRSFVWLPFWSTLLSCEGRNVCLLRRITWVEA